MSRIIPAGLIGALVLGVTWYGWLYYVSRDARKFDSAEVFVTFHGSPTLCGVTARGQTVQHPLPCGDVQSYLRNNLKLVTGATFGASDMGNTHGSEIASL